MYYGYKAFCWLHVLQKSSHLWLVFWWTEVLLFKAVEYINHFLHGLYFPRLVQETFPSLLRGHEDSLLSCILRALLCYLSHLNLRVRLEMMSVCMVWRIRCSVPSCGYPVVPASRTGKIPFPVAPRATFVLNQMPICGWGCRWGTISDFFLVLSVSVPISVWLPLSAFLQLYYMWGRSIPVSCSSRVLWLFQAFEFAYKFLNQVCQVQQQQYWNYDIGIVLE